MIEQLQYTGAESVSSTQNKLRLNFNHPCKELIWVVSRDAATSVNDWQNYETAAGTNPVASAKLQLNGHDRFYQREGSYFNLVQPYSVHTNIPESAGINCYSFGLRPEEHQPSGTCNMSRIDNATLNITMDPTVGFAQCKIFATNSTKREIETAAHLKTHVLFAGKMSKMLVCEKVTSNADELREHLIYLELTTSFRKELRGPRSNAGSNSHNSSRKAIRSQAPTFVMQEHWRRFRDYVSADLHLRKLAIFEEDSRYSPAMYKHTWRASIEVRQRFNSQNVTAANKNCS